ncbi:PEP-CTERM/exosortase A-associated glycosyltransferase, family [Terricaulis silvestris]|uniref:PEP-CTERM/exosortase A-associated glycosyltransferase, family n=1 Tax=Terricaulis silvestris TaxID=2686094 RepID=A0A6I6MI99_9CAUL|nr:PEP-CTERM/exosortase A-associated glycosyltransferase, family [Terricaulis silvestris]
MSGTIAIVSPHFPPCSLAGVHRARHLAKHLPAHGWRPIVIRAHETQYTERLDPDLAALVPNTVEQIATGAMPASVTRLIGVGDIGLRGFLHFKRALSQLAQTTPLRAVLITGSPYYPMLLAKWISHDLQLPVVLDFQDPWVSSWGATLPELSKGGLAHRLAVMLEPKALRHAAFVTSVSEIQNQEMAARYPWINPKRMAAIPIGGDPEDFNATQTHHSATASTVDRSERAELVFVGSVWPRLSNTLDVFLDAVAQVAKTNPAIAQRLAIRFYGTDARLVEPPVYQVAQQAERKGISFVVEEFPRRLSFVQALATMAGARGVILLGSDEPHYTASKIYPALMSGRPYLSVFHAASSSHSILSRAGGGVSLGFEDAEAIRNLIDPISEALVRLACEPRSFCKSDPAAFEAYTAHAVAGRFAAIFESIAQGTTASQCASLS